MVREVRESGLVTLEVLCSGLKSNHNEGLNTFNRLKRNPENREVDAFSLNKAMTMLVRLHVLVDYLDDETARYVVKGRRTVLRITNACTLYEGLTGRESESDKSHVGAGASLNKAILKHKDGSGVSVISEVKEGTRGGPKKRTITNDTVIYFYHRLLQPGKSIADLAVFTYHGGHKKTKKIL